MARASDNEYPSVLFDEQASAPTTPGTGLWRAYFKSDGLYIVDDAGAETGPLSTGGGGGSTFSGASATKSGNQLISNNTNNTLVLFDTEEFDTDSYHDLVSNTSRLTVSTAGKYLLIGHINYEADSAGNRIMQFFKNGTVIKSFIQDAVPSSGATTISGSMIVDASVSDYYEISTGLFGAGANRNVTDACFFQITRL